MRARSKIDGKIYILWSSETFGNDIQLNFVTEDGSRSSLFGVRGKGGSKIYNSLGRIAYDWQEVF